MTSQSAPRPRVRSRVRRGAFTTAAIGLVALLAGCDTVGEFSDWARESVTTTAALMELTGEISTIDRVERADYVFDPGDGVKTATIDVRMRDNSPGDWAQVLAILRPYSSDERLTYLPVTVTLTGDEVDVTLKLVDAESTELASGVHAVLQLQDAFGVPIAAGFEPLLMTARVERSATEFADLLSEPSIRVALDRTASAGLQVQGPAFLLGPGAPPESVVDLYREMTSILPDGVCMLGGCPETVRESADLMWWGDGFSVGYYSKDNPLGAPSVQAVEILRHVLETPTPQGSFVYYFTDPPDGGNFPSAQVLASFCEQSELFTDVGRENAASFRAGLIAAGLDVPFERFGYCLSR